MLRIGMVIGKGQGSDDMPASRFKTGKEAFWPANAGKGQKRCVGELLDDAPFWMKSGAELRNFLRDAGGKPSLVSAVDYRQIKLCQTR